MPVQLKHAWFNLIVCLLTLAAIGILLPLVGPAHAIAGFAFFSLAALPTLLYRRKRGIVQWDERDHQIHLRSLKAAFAAAWGFLVLVCLWAFYRGKPVEAQWFSYMLMGGWIVVTFSQSLAVIVQYRRLSA